MSLPAARPSAPRSARIADVALVVMLCGLSMRWLLPSAWNALWHVPTLQAWTVVFAAICVQATPYVVLGVLLSSVVAALPDRVLGRLVPRNPVLAVPVAALLGAALPGCECGSVPVAVSLLRRGVAAGPATALMLSAPATNPVVLAATAAAFPGRPGVVAARFAASIAVAAGTGWIMARRPMAEKVVGCEHVHAAGARTLVDRAARDLAQSLGLVTIGAASAACVGVLLPASALSGFGGSPVGGVLILAVLAVVLAVCSEADAFVASSLTSFSLTAQVVFMVVGPALDLKLAAMHVGAFGRAIAARLGGSAFLLALLSCPIAVAVFT